VREYEIVNRYLGGLILRDQLEDKLPFLLSRRSLHIGNLQGIESELTQDMLPPNHLNQEPIRTVAGQVPMKVLVIEENAFLGAGPYDAVGVLHQPVPKSR
jgi:hypothetical protein